MLTMVFTITLVAVIGLSTTRRMVMNGSTPWLLWPVLLAAMAVAPVTAWTALFPGPAADSAAVSAEGDAVSLEVPEGHALLVTGDLVPLEEVDLEDEAYRKTSYVLKLDGGEGRQSISGEVVRTAETAGPVESYDDGQDSARAVAAPRVLWLGQNIQARYRLDSTGEVALSVYNWHGMAARRLVLEVVPDTPSDGVLLAVVAALSLLAIVCDARLGTDRLSADVGFLSVTGPFIAHNITPAGGLGSTLFHFAAALVVGGLSVGLLGSLAERLFGPPE